MQKYLQFFGLIIIIGLGTDCGPKKPSDLPATSLRMNRLLMEKLTPETNFGSSGKILRANSLWNWGFADEVQIIHHSNFQALPIKIESNGAPVLVKGGIYYPSHSVLESETDSTKNNIAYNPFCWGYPQPITSIHHSDKTAWGPIDGKTTASTSWTCQGTLRRQDWYGVDFGKNTTVLSVVLEFFVNDYCQLPQSYYLEYQANGNWQRIPEQRFYPARPDSGQNLIVFPQLRLQKIRVVLKHQTGAFYSGLIQFKIQGECVALPEVHEEKFITMDDVMVSLIKIFNPSWHFPLQISVSAATHWASAFENGFLLGQVCYDGINFYLAAGASGLNSNQKGCLENQFSLAPRASRVFRVVMAVHCSEATARIKAKEWHQQIRPLNRHQAEYQQWFHDNIPYFYCPDRELTRTYYQYWHNIRRNQFAPDSPFLPFPAISSGSANTSTFAVALGNQAVQLVRDVRWLRNPRIHQDFIRNFTLNMNQAGLYPASISANAVNYPLYDYCGLTLAIWEAFLVQPDQQFLQEQLPLMERNVNAWRRIYDPDQDFLLTDHEFDSLAQQQSAQEIPDQRRVVEKVDLTSQFYGNTLALARALAATNQKARANHFFQLAEQIKTNLLSQMWDEQTKYFYSIDATTHQPIKTRLIGGLYPFSFQLPDLTHLPAWQPLINQINVKTADFSIQNAFILSTMVQTLQHYSDSVITGEHFWQLFATFFQAQKRDWTAERPSLAFDFTGDTLISENQSYRPDQQAGLVNLIITGIVGLVPTEEEKIVLHPLLPASEWSYFVLERVPFKGHE